MTMKRDKEFHMNIEENVTIKQYQHFKCVSAILYKNIQITLLLKFLKEKQIIGCPNSLWWDKIYVWKQNKR